MPVEDKFSTVSTVLPEDPEGGEDESSYMTTCTPQRVSSALRRRGLIPQRGIFLVVNRTRTPKEVEIVLFGTLSASVLATIRYILQEHNWKTVNGETLQAAIQRRSFILTFLIREGTSPIPSSSHTPPQC